ncbi:hypothetical protein GQ53DRAFT_742414 [Thozetella sp. PMI_491]|nr:hypothetical protein GQ53DRAFT_742414 [Thozetella sp. PMI_491]
MYSTGMIPGANAMDLNASPSTPPSSGPSLTGKYRRNGKLQSCEPCRKSKLRCDHTVPVCGRCIKRRCIDQCIYHPNPLTQPRKTTPTPGPSLPTPSASCSTTHGSPPDVVQSIEQSIEQSVEQSSYDPYPCVAAQTPLPRIVERPPHTCAPHRAASAPLLDTRAHEPVPANQGHRFFGATSYSSIFAEGLDNIEALPEAPAEKTMAISADRIAKGCEVLMFLKKRAMINQFVSRWYEICEDTSAVTLDPIVKEWLMKLWLHHSDTLTFENPEKVRKLSELIWRNTQTPLKVEGKTTLLEFARMATGHNLRWEVVGLIASNVGLFATTVDPSDDCLKNHKTTRHGLFKSMVEVAETCLSFCRDCGAFEDIFAWLLGETAGVVQALKGDTSFAAYRASGEAIDFIIASGWHLGSRPSANLPFFLAETRNRVVAFTYSMEIGIAAFLGRPPRLSYRYCNVPKPMDLTDRQISLPEHELAKVLADLDEHGNHKNGRITRMTYYRCCFGLYPRREDIVDLALGDYTREEVVARARVIQQKTDELWACFPAAMVKTRDESLDLRNLSPLETLHKSAMKQGFRANELLLQRVLIRKAGASSERLIQLAREILSDILLISQRHDISALFKMDVTAILTVHGLRSAAILGVELLKQEQLPVYPEKPLLPRSQTIQDLSVFANRLGAVDPLDGAYSMCQQGRKLVVRLLDKILAPKISLPPLRYEQQQQQQQKERQMDIDSSGYEMQDQGGMQMSLGPSQPPMEAGYGFDGQLGVGNDMDFMQWLQNTDMEQADVWTTF